MVLAVGDTQTGATGDGNPVENHQPTLAIRYMIAVQGIFPDDNPNGSPNQNSAPDRSIPFLGEIKPIAFNFAPKGWMLCEGQLLPINQNQALFSLLGNTYGGNGQTNFALPDLRGRVPMGAGQGPGLSDYPLGTIVGSNTLVLSESNLPAHTHTVGNGNTAPTGSGAPLDNRQPSIALHFLIASNSEIMIAPWPQQPTGWSHCDGRLLSRGGHMLLFTHIANLYGGDFNEFALPDVRGRIVLGDDTTDQINSWPIARTVGFNDAVLGVSDMPAHTHTIPNGVTGSTGGGGNTASNDQPSIVMHWIISIAGSFPSQSFSGDFPMVGELRLLAATAASGLASDFWKKLDGTLYPPSGDTDALYNLIGTTYGSDNQNNFAVPDLRSLATMAVTTNFPIASFVGFQALMLSVPQLAPHAHALVPEIGVEQPIGTGLADGLAQIDFGSISANGGSVEKTFTIRNTGAMDLILGSITKDGTNASDFAVSAPGATTLVPGGSTTFTVTFNPATAGSRTAAIHIASNDGDEDPFDITLTGRRLTHQEEWRQQYFGKITNSGQGADTNDFEKDGLTNLVEFAIGSNPKQFTPTPGTMSRVGNTLEFVYQRSKAALADGFTFQVNFTDDLGVGGWSNNGVTEEIISEDAQIQVVRASLAILSTQPKSFGRLRIIPP